MDVTVIVLTYDNADTIAGCLSSVLVQVPAPVEVLVVDDDSTDHTLALVAAHTGGPVPVRVIRNGHHNISRGRNLGIAAATTDLIAFIDSDAYAEPGWLAALTTAFDTDPTLAVAGGDVIADHATPFAEAIATNDTAVRRLAARGILLVSTCNLAVHRGRLHQETFDERWVYAEDVEFLHRVGRWQFVPSARVLHESRPSPRRYLKQMHAYGAWKVRFSIATGQWRAVDYTPLTAILLSVTGTFITPWALLLYPAMAVAETTVCAILMRAPARHWPRMLTGWLIKNTGWGTGTTLALLQQATGRTQVPTGPPTPVQA